MIFLCVRGWITDSLEDLMKTVPRKMHIPKILYLVVWGKWSRILD